ncbi:hypothetical protein IMSHALPRED_010159 [Imshaugia aleurites]|uniref:Uncharacterized protein n=1 Tax=Imshaugia aleurites TaxID=172621 RepID=A0A8H3G251_9LECA|nr:hypothetical protein IMSHALPRED_010159 [Imshaugia aleurites]
MCIQWCCKHCSDKFTKLTHRSAHERCNDYFIARSQNEHTTACPNGPWELRRAYHRHPYRGVQRCDDCIKAGRKGSKIAQLARQQANVALGQRPAYTGTVFLGELEIPDTFHNAQRRIEPGNLDARTSSLEGLSSANEHLPSHEVERRWATKVTAFDVNLDPGIEPRPPMLATNPGQHMGEAHHDPGTTALAAEHSQTRPQQAQYAAPSSMHKPIETSQSPRRQAQHDEDSTTKSANSMTVEEETSRKARQHLHSHTSSDADRRDTTAVKEAAFQNPHHETYRNTSSETTKRNHPTLEQTKPHSQNPHREAPSTSPPAPCSSPSQSRSTRTRPWDL